MPVKKKNPYEDDRKHIETDKAPENRPETYNTAPQSDAKGELVTFSVQIPKSQREALDKYLKREKGLKRSSFVRQLITEYMRRERIW